MASPLADLDELVLKCRDKKAKSYIREAVACYKSGAFRSAIVSTWIAVAFDVIDKFKELSLAGDKAAEAEIIEFERARVANDIASSLKFERELLTKCRDKLEIISHVEFVDLDRLQQDRNRCAHPSLTADSEIFNPSAELARVHIRSAVDHLLQHPPAQGKYALGLLLSEVDSEYFPIELDRALIILKNGPLLKARQSLVTNFLVMLLKKILKTHGSAKEVSRCLTALSAVEVMYHGCYDECLSEKLPNIIRSLEAGELHRVLPLLIGPNDCWELLDDDVQLKMSAYVEDLPSERFDQIPSLVGHIHLAASVKSRIKKATKQELIDSPFIEDDGVVSKVVEEYIGSGSFASANNLASAVIRYASLFSKQQIENVIRACGDNDQITYSRGIGSVIKALRLNANATRGEVDTWLKEVKLPEYVEGDEPKE